MKSLKRFSLFLSLFVFAWADPPPKEGAKPKLKNVYQSKSARFKLEKLRSGNDVVWGFDFLPDKKILFTERSGRLFIFDLKTQKEVMVKGLPPVAAGGQGGLLDVCLHPQFKKNRLIFFTYSKRVSDETTTALASAELKGNKLLNLKILFTAEKANKVEAHYGSRIVWESDDVLFVSIGERTDRFLAQDWSVHNGKILRLTIDGKPAAGNPFVGLKGTKPEIWSYGHRNPQALAMNSKGVLFEAEFGPQGGDEVNIIKKATNYGWPIITYGREYEGPKIGEGTHKKGMEQPLVYWVPSISPSGMNFYTGNLFPKWKDNLFLAALSSMHLHRVVLNEKNEVIDQEELLNDQYWRIRHVRTGPDGYLYLSTDDGTLARLVPAT